MATSKTELIVPEEVVMSKIYYIRGHKVMLDQDLSVLYEVETKRLKEAVRRNIDRFPLDFMFELTWEELENLRTHFATSSWGGTRYTPMAFTEHGVLMLSGILKSARAIKVNIQIMRIYTKMREMLLTHKDILIKLEQLEKQTFKNTGDIQVVFDYLKKLMTPPEQANRQRIGFKRPDEKN